MQVRLLGPLEVFTDDGSVDIGSGKRPALLANLLIHANEVVSAERLIDELWDEHPPVTAAKSVQVYVSQLRKALSADGELLAASVRRDADHAHRHPRSPPAGCAPDLPWSGVDPNQGLTDCERA